MSYPEREKELMMKATIAAKQKAEEMKKMDAFTSAMETVRKATFEMISKPLTSIYPEREKELIKKSQETAKNLSRQIETMKIEAQTRAENVKKASEQKIRSEQEKPSSKIVIPPALPDVKKAEIRDREEELARKAEKATELAAPSMVPIGGAGLLLLLFLVIGKG